jgi:hypothetical protein
MTRELNIPAPDPARPPMISNVFHAVRSANTKLMPMFPYTEAGCLVPGASVFSGGKGSGIGVFTHTNSVDEVAITFASVGSGIRTGDVFVGAREHMVGGFFHEEEADQNLMVIVVVQRQAEAGVAQHESLSFICGQCQAPLSRVEYPARTDHGGGDAAAALETLTDGAIWAREFNASEDLRTCKKCGHVNPPFPLGVWGWEEYRRNYETAEKARELYLSQAARSGQSKVSHAAT